MYVYILKQIKPVRRNMMMPLTHNLYLKSIYDSPSVYKFRHLFVNIHNFYLFVNKKTEFAKHMV